MRTISFFIFAVLLVFLGAGCIAPSMTSSSMSERVSMQTSDRVTLVGTFVSPSRAKNVVLLLHMLPRDRTSWSSFQKTLEAAGLASLAIDLRGHGESTDQAGKKLDYRNFSDAQHQGYVTDAEAALAWLKEKGFDESHVVLVGASIGANAAVRVAAERHAIPALVLLSPGENYRGILTYDAARALGANQAVWAAGSAGDDQAAYDAAKKITEIAPSTDKTFKPYQSAGHAMALFDADSSLADTLARWIAAHVSP